MAVMIDLPPEQQRKLDETARRRGTTPDALANEWVIERLSHEVEDLEGDVTPASLAEFLEGYAGVFDSRDFAPDALPMSERTGEQFADILEEKHRQGHL
jgi:hypothetical protein